MKIVVGCRCGRRFATDRRHSGKTVLCPSCQAALTIAEAAAHAPAPPLPTRSSPAALPGIRVSCACGWAFHAPAAYEGQQLPCPACHSAVQVPSSDPLGLGGAAATPLSSQNAWLAPEPPADPFTEKLAQRLIQMAVGSVALLALAILVTAIINSLLRPRGESVVAESKPAPPAATAPEKRTSPPPLHAAKPAPLPPAPPPAASAPVEVPAPPALSDDPTAKIATVPVPLVPERATSQVRTLPSKAALPETRPAGDETISRLPEASRSWLDQPEAKLLGVRRVGPVAHPGANFSWLTGLLPFLDHQEIYERIDFIKPVTTAGNLTAGTAVIPAFLGPHDDRQRWEGYPYAGLALSHFAGMSGVEDSRNVVAAKLSRSDPRAGVFGYDDVARDEDITDGTSQTIMVVGTGAMANPWIMGGGGTIRGAREPLFDGVTGLGTKGLAGGGTLAVMADGSVRHVTANIDPKVFKAMCTIHGAETVDIERAAKPFAREQWKTITGRTPHTSRDRSATN